MGDLTQSQGDQGQNQGDQTESLGDLAQSQGNQTESLGDLTQSQGGETQGDQSQGDQSQTMTGHEGQIQGDQFLLNTPTITAPVTVSGLNLNVTVTCGDKGKEPACRSCKDIISGFLCLLKLLSVIEPSTAEVTFYGCCQGQLPLTGTLTEVIDHCLAVITPGTGGTPITVLTDALDMIVVNAAGTDPSLFYRLLSYLQAPVCSLDDCCKENDRLCDHCTEKNILVLQSYLGTNSPILFETACSQAAGYLYKICGGIAFIVDDPENPTEITALPVCKISCWQIQEGV